MPTVVTAVSFLVFEEPDSRGVSTIILYEALPLSKVHHQPIVLDFAAMSVPDNSETITESIDEVVKLHSCG
jgi:hypothetical protein